MKLALSDKLRENRLVVLDEISLDSHRTKDVLAALKGLDLDSSRKVLIVDERENRNLYLGVRNMPEIKMVATLGVNIYDLLNHPHLVISKRSILALQEVLKR